MADADYNVYYAEGVVLPKLWEMEIDLIRIVETATQSYSVGTVDDAATVERVIALYQNGFSVPYTDADCNFRVKELESERLAFSSEKYGGFYYVLQYYRFEESVTLTREVEDFDSFAPTLDFPYALEEHNGRTYVRYDMGKNFLHDPATGLCYPTGTLLDSYYHNAN